MKAIQVSTLYCKGVKTLKARADGVKAIARSEGLLEVSNPYSDIAHQLANKHDWLQNGKFHLEEAGLPNGDRVFVFIKNEVEPESDIRRDFRKLLEKYKAQLVVLDYCHQPSDDITVRFESTGKFPRDILIEFDYSVVNSSDYYLSEESIADV